MNKLSAVLAALSLAAFAAAAWVSLSGAKEEAAGPAPQAYYPAFSKRIEHAVKTLTDGEKIYAITHDLNLIAYDRAGKTVFERKLSKKSYPQAFAENGGRIFIGTEDGDVICVSAESGEEIWSAEVGEKIASGFGFHGGTVLFGAFDRRLHALDSEGGPVFSIKSADAINGRIETRNGMAYFGNCAGQAEAADISRGEKLWTAEVGGHIPLAPALAGGRLIVADFQGGVSALDPASGNTLWKNPNLKAAVETQIEPFGENFLFADADGTLILADSADGSAIRSAAFGQKRMELCVDAGVAVLALSDGRVEIIDMADFKPVFECDLQIRLDSASASGGVAAVLDADYVLHVFLKR